MSSFSFSLVSVCVCVCVCVRVCVCTGLTYIVVSTRIVKPNILWGPVDGHKENWLTVKTGQRQGIQVQ